MKTPHAPRLASSSSNERGQSSPATATARGRRGACRRFGNGRSSSIRFLRGRSAGPWRRTPDRGRRNDHGPPFRSWNAVTFSGTCAAALLSEANGPFAKDGVGGVEEAGDLASLELAREPSRRQTRAVEDLVGVGVADPGKERGSVSERLSVCDSRRSASANWARVASSGSTPPGIERAQSVLAADDVQRRALLRARLGEQKRPAREVEGSEPELLRDRPRRAPSSGSGRRSSGARRGKAPLRARTQSACPRGASRERARLPGPAPADRRCGRGTGSQGGRARSDRRWSWRRWSRCRRRGRGARAYAAARRAYSRGDLAIALNAVSNVAVVALPLRRRSGSRWKPVVRRAHVARADARVGRAHAV